VSHLVELHDLTVSEIMTKRPICLRPVVRVGEVFDMLKRVKHHCFPIGELCQGGVRRDREGIASSLGLLASVCKAW